MNATALLLFLLPPVQTAAPAATPPAPSNTADETSRLAWADQDGDGRLDLYVADPGGGRLLLQGADRRFVEAAPHAVDAVPGRRAAWRDVDGDGAVDLVVWGADGGHVLFGEGPGVLRDATIELGLEHDGGVVHAIEWLDVDGDGRDDLILSAEASVLVYRAESGRQFLPFDMGDMADRGTTADPGARPLGTTATTSPPLELAPDGAAVAATPDTTPSTPLTPGPLEPGQRRLAEPAGGDLGVTVTPTGTGPGAPPFAEICAPRVMDAMGGCLEASSSPMLGTLMPLSLDFNVASWGYVGIGTTSPASKLHVAGNVRTTGRFVSTTTSEPPFTVSSSQMVPSLNADMLDGVHASSFSQLGSSIEGGEITNGTITDADIGTNAAISGTKIDSDFGSQYVTTTSRVGVGTISPEVNLQVSSGSDVGLGAGGFAVFGTLGSLNIGIDNNEIMARQGANAARLALNVEGGDVTISQSNSSGKLGIGTAVPTGRLHVADATGGDGSVVLPNDAISAPEIDDEPGVASNLNAGTLTLNSSVKTLTSRTITVPADGYVIASAFTSLESGVSPGFYNGFLSIEDVPTSLGTSDVSMILPAVEKQVASITKVFSVNAGANAFYFRGRTVSSSFPLSASRSRLTLLYVPTSYGAVVE